MSPPNSSEWAVDGSAEHLLPSTTSSTSTADNVVTWMKSSRVIPTKWVQSSKPRSKADKPRAGFSKRFRIVRHNIARRHGILRPVLLMLVILVCAGIVLHGGSSNSQTAKKSSELNGIASMDKDEETETTTDENDETALGDLSESWHNSQNEEEKDISGYLSLHQRIPAYWRQLPLSNDVINRRAALYARNELIPKDGLGSTLRSSFYGSPNFHEQKSVLSNALESRVLRFVNDIVLGPGSDEQSYTRDDVAAQHGRRADIGVDASHVKLKVVRSWSNINLSGEQDPWRLRPNNQGDMIVIYFAEVTSTTKAVFYDPGGGDIGAGIPVHDAGLLVGFPTGIMDYKTEVRALSRLSRVKKPSFAIFYVFEVKVSVASQEMSRISGLLKTAKAARPWFGFNQDRERFSNPANVVVEAEMPKGRQQLWAAIASKLEQDETGTEDGDSDEETETDSEADEDGDETENSEDDVEEFPEEGQNYENGINNEVRNSEDEFENEDESVSHVAVTRNLNMHFPNALPLKQLAFYHRRMDSNVVKEALFDPTRRGWSCRSAVLASSKSIKVDWRSTNRDAIADSAGISRLSNKNLENSVSVERCQPRIPEKIPTTAEIKTQLGEAVQGLLKEFQQVGNPRSISLNPQFPKWMFETTENEGEDNDDKATSSTSEEPHKPSVRVKGMQAISYIAKTRKTKTGDANDVPTLSLSLINLNRAPYCHSSQAMTAIISDVVEPEESSGESAALLGPGVPPGAAKCALIIRDPKYERAIQRTRNVMSEVVLPLRYGLESEKREVISLEPGTILLSSAYGLKSLVDGAWAYLPQGSKCRLLVVDLCVKP